MTVAWDLTEYRHPGHADQSVHGNWATGQSDGGLDGEPISADRMYSRDKAAKVLQHATHEAGDPSVLKAEAARQVADGMASTPLADIKVANTRLVEAMCKVKNLTPTDARMLLYDAFKRNEPGDGFITTDRSGCVQALTRGEVIAKMSSTRYPKGYPGGSEGWRRHLESVDDDALAAEYAGYRGPDARVARSGTMESEAQLREGFASMLIQSWAGTSNDSNPMSLAVQNAAEQVFGIRGATEWTGDRNQSDMLLSHRAEAVDLARRLVDGPAGPAVRAYVAAVYRETQDRLARERIDTVMLARGQGSSLVRRIREQAGDDAEGTLDMQVTMRPLSAWSSAHATAEEFAEDADSGDGYAVITTRIPAERIWSFPLTGAGCAAEQEWIVLGPHVEGRVAWTVGTGRVDDYPY